MTLTVDHKKFFISAFVLLILCVAVHTRGLHGQFMIDDYKYIHDARNPVSEESLAEIILGSRTLHYNPLNLFVNQSLFRLFNEPLPLHVVNPMLFYVACLALLAFVLVITKNNVLAFLGSTLFCIHPMSAEVVDHITLNIIIIGSIFQQVALLAFWKSEESGKKIFYVISILCFLGALLSCEMALLLPLFVFSYSYFMIKADVKGSLARSLPFFIIAVLYFMLWLWMAGLNVLIGASFSKANIAPINYLATFAKLVAWYVRNLFFPLDIVFIKNVDVLKHGLWGWAGWLAGGVISICIAIKMGRKSFPSFVLIWFCAGFLLAMPAVLAHTFMGMVIEPNWFFFSSQGFFILLAWLLWQSRSRPWIYFGSLVCISFYWVAATQYQHSVNRSEWAYAEHWLHNSPKNMQATAMMGNLYVNSQEYELRSVFIPDVIRLARIYYANGLKEDAVKIVKKLTRIKEDPGWDRKMLIDLAVIGRSVGVAEEFVELSAYLTDRFPGPDTYLQLGVEFDRHGMSEDALRFLNESIRSYPEFPEAYFLTGVIMANQDRFEEAIAVLEKGTDVAPADPRFSELIKQIRYLQQKGGIPRPPVTLGAEEIYLRSQ